MAVSPEQNPNFFPKQSERGLICAPRPLPAVAGGASSPRSVVTLNLCDFDTGRGNSKNMDCARHKQILLCLTHPPVRAQIPAVLRRYYKTAGAPSKPIQKLF